MQLPDYLTEDADGHVHFTGHRIGLQDLLFHYNQGWSVEMLAADFPSLSLALIHKCLGYYLDHQAELDRWLKETDLTMESLRAASPLRPTVQELRDRINSMRQVSSNAP